MYKFSSQQVIYNSTAATKEQCPDVDLFPSERDTSHRQEEFPCEASISLHGLQRVNGGGHLDASFSIPRFYVRTLEITCLRTHRRETIPRRKTDLCPANVSNSVWTPAKLAAFLLSVVFIVGRENSWCLKSIRSYKKFLTSFIHYEINESKLS